MVSYLSFLFLLCVSVLLMLNVVCFSCVVENIGLPNQKDVLYDQLLFLVDCVV